MQSGTEDAVELNATDSIRSIAYYWQERTD